LDVSYQKITAGITTCCKTKEKDFENICATERSNRRIELFDTNRVRLTSGRQVFSFESDETEKIFDYLLKSFVNDHYGKKSPIDSSGWRSMVEIVKNIGARSTSLYSPRSSILLRDLIKRGAVERKFFQRKEGEVVVLRG
jgi:hypothetical protein